MKVWSLILSYSIYLKFFQCEYSHFSKVKLVSKKYFKHLDRKLSSVSPSSTFTTSANGCIVKCHHLADDCKSLNVFENGTNTNQCEIFDDEGTPEYAEGWTYLSQRKPEKCAAYCDNVVGLCGRCQCIDRCESNIPYLCDCRNVQSQVFTECDNINVKRSGIYNINPDGIGNITVYCDTRLVLQNEHGKPYITIFRRFKEKSFNPVQVDYENGFSNNMDSYWLGLEKIYRIASKPVELRVDYITDSLIYKTLYYRRFQMYKDDISYYFNYQNYEDQSLDGTGSTADIFKCSIYEDFKDCGNGFWWKNCDGNPTRPDELIWGDDKVIYVKILIRYEDAVDNPPDNQKLLCNDKRKNDCGEAEYYINPDGQARMRVGCFWSLNSQYIMIRTQLMSGTLTRDDYVKGFTQPQLWTGFENIYRMCKAFRMTLRFAYHFGVRWEVEHYYNFQIIDNISFEIKYDSFEFFPYTLDLKGGRALQNGDTLMECPDKGFWWRCFSAVDNNLSVSPMTNNLNYYGYNVVEYHIILQHDPL